VPLHSQLISSTSPSRHPPHDLRLSCTAQVIASPLHRLRVQLHLEAAKCDAAEDSLIKV
jgi:hypothetical protein